jgi:hypothetical protein
MFSNKKDTRPFFLGKEDCPYAPVVCKMIDQSKQDRPRVMRPSLQGV